MKNLTFSLNKLTLHPLLAKLPRSNLEFRDQIQAIYPQLITTIESSYKYPTGFYRKKMRKLEGEETLKVFQGTRNLKEKKQKLLRF